jgi:hypothetical protein
VRGKRGRERRGEERGFNAEDAKNAEEDAERKQPERSESAARRADPTDREFRSRYLLRKAR